MRRNRLLRRATTSEVETVTKLWLRYSCDRSGGQRVRMQRDQQYTDSDAE